MKVGKRRLPVLHGVMPHWLQRRRLPDLAIPLLVAKARLMLRKEFGRSGLLLL